MSLAVPEAGLSSESRMLALRWPDGPYCPECGESDVCDRRPRRGRRLWRCRCRHEFTVTSGTQMHASKIGLDAWCVACDANDDSPASVAAMLHVTLRTARRISAMLRSTGEPAGDRRLAALLGASPPGGVRDDRPRDPLRRRPESHRRIMAALRARPAGATASLIAEDVGLSQRHTRRCLESLRSAGFARRSCEVILWGYQHRTVVLWRLARTQKAVASLPWLPRLTARDPDLGVVPVAFWHLFWSGTPAGDLRLDNDEDRLHVASTLIGQDAIPEARSWALTRLPLDTLRVLRGMTGHDHPPDSDTLDAAIKARSARE